MRKLLVMFPLLVVALTASAAELRFNVTCPRCFNEQTLTPRSIRTNGSYRAETIINGTNTFGNVLKRWAEFKCNSGVCRNFKFTTAIQPDTFIPIFPATPAEDRGRPVTARATPLLVCTNECCAGKSAVLVPLKIAAPDGVPPPPIPPVPPTEPP